MEEGHKSHTNQINQLINNKNEDKHDKSLLDSIQKIETQMKENVNQIVTNDMRLKKHSRNVEELNARLDALTKQMSHTQKELAMKVEREEIDKLINLLNSKGGNVSQIVNTFSNKDLTLLKDLSVRMGIAEDGIKDITLRSRALLEIPQLREEITAIKLNIGDEIKNIKEALNDKVNDIQVNTLLSI